MLASLEKAIYEAVSRNAPESALGIAFSGGIDSAMLAVICSRLGKQLTLITTGFPGSHDLVFSKHISALLGFNQRTLVIEKEDFMKTLAYVRKVIPCDNTSHIENCLAYHYIATAAKQEGLQIVLSANGCDELFCGYNSYRLAFDKGPQGLSSLMEEKIANEYQLVGEISAITNELGITVRQPFLDPHFISFAKTIPLEFKIRGSDDMLRKHILRDFALSLGVPRESAMKPKKALQYGSLIHKNFQMSRKLRAEF